MGSPLWLNNGIVAQCGSVVSSPCGWIVYLVRLVSGKVPDWLPVADNNTEEKKTSVADDESKRWRKGKGAAHRVEERAQAAYAYILEGGTRIQIAEKIVSRFNVSLRTAHDDYKRAMQLLREEQTGTREELLNQLQALRLATVQKALKRGHFQTVATLLGDMGRVIGEAAPEQLALQVPTLDIRIENENQSQ